MNRPTRRGPFSCALALSLALAAPTILPAIERGGDGDYSERKSAHFHLFQDVAIDRWDGPRGWRRFEIGVLDALERAYDLVGKRLGIWPSTHVRVFVYEPEQFDAQFADRFGFRAVGVFDGMIHVRGKTEITGALVGTLAHEYTHAALQHEYGSGLFPGWLNEGLAEYIQARATGYRGLSSGRIRLLQQAVESGNWIPLEQLSAPSFAHLSGPHASLAYLEAHAMVEHLAHRHGEQRLRRLCEELGHTRNLQRAIDRTYRQDLVKLERALIASLR